VDKGKEPIHHIKDMSDWAGQKGNRVPDLFLNWAPIFFIFYWLEGSTTKDNTPFALKIDAAIVR
jgi:hypothetical protein